MQPSQGSGSQQIFCPRCGLANPQQAKFCGRCGYRLVQPVGQGVQGIPHLPQEPGPAPRPQPPNWPVSPGVPPVPPPFMPPATPPGSSPVYPTQPTSPSSPQPPYLPAAVYQFSDQFVELWWTRIPTRLRRSSVLLSEIWRDGSYLSIRPLAATLFPFLLFFIGTIEGLTHWSILTNPSVGDETLVPFTQLFPLLLLTAAASAFSMNLGLTIVLGYALGDTLHTAFDVHNPSLAESYATPQTTVLNIYVPHLVSYVIFALLVVLPTLYAKGLTQRLHRLIHSTSSPVGLQTAVGACIVGGVVYAWIQATPLLIRTFWGWGWYSLATSTAAMYYLQQPQTSNQIILIAVIAFVLRNVLEYHASRNPSVREREERLRRGFEAADAHPTVLRRLPPVLRALVPAAVMTLVLGGILAEPGEGLIFFLFLWFLLIMRGTILPRFGFWTSWAQLVARVPVLVRLLAALFIIYLLAWSAINLSWAQATLFVATPSATFEPYLLTTGISVTIMTLLLPQAQPTGQEEGKEA
jgi:hypothetical protein